MMGRVSEENKVIFLLGDMNINWLDTKCPVRKKVFSVCSACNLTQFITVPTRVQLNAAGVKTTTCIVHIYTNVPKSCNNIISIPAGFSKHHLVATNRKIKHLKAAQKITNKRFFKNLNIECFSFALKILIGMIYALNLSQRLPYQCLVMFFVNL